MWVKKSQFRSVGLTHEELGGDNCLRGMILKVYDDSDFYFKVYYFLLYK